MGRVVLVVVLCMGTSACGVHRSPEELAARYVEAKARYAAGELEEAERLLAAILASDRRFHQAAFLLGKVYFFENRMGEARKVFAALSRGQRRHNEAEIWLVRAMVQEGETDAAVRAVERLLSFDAGDPRLLFLRGTLALEQEDLEAALEFFQAAAGFGDELARTHLEIARLYHQFGLPARALEELDACLALASPGSLVGDAAGRLAPVLRKEAHTP
jgi:predicted Zn-dependent protease